MMFNAATIISDDTFPSKYIIFTFLNIISIGLSNGIRKDTCLSDM